MIEFTCRILGYNRCNTKQLLFRKWYKLF